MIFKGQNILFQPFWMEDCWNTRHGLYDDRHLWRSRRGHDEENAPKPANYKLYRSAVGGRIRSEVEKLGGKIIVPKSAVPGMGYFIICMDTENNAFGIWETNSTAK